MSFPRAYPTPRQPPSSSLTPRLISLGVATLLVLLGWISLPTVTRAKPTDSAPVLRECTPETITAPVMPSRIPATAELDPATGLHVTGNPLQLDHQTYRLEITGKVARPLSLTYDQLRCLPALTVRSTLVCPGFFEDTASWTGASLAAVLDLAGIKKRATHLRLVGADGYASLLALDRLTDTANLLAYRLEQEVLPVLHGFPVRAVFPGQQGNKWVKWLIRIEVQ